MIQSGLTNDTGNAVRLLDQLDRIANSGLDRGFLRRAVAEGNSLDTSSRTNCEDWLIKAAQIVNVRVQRFQGVLRDMRKFLADGYQVVAFRSDPNQPAAWTLIEKAAGRKWLVADSASASGRWVSTGYLLRLLQLNSDRDPRNWLIVKGNLAVPEDHFSRTAAKSELGARTLSPAARLGKLLVLERRDLINVLIFSVVISVLTLASPLAVEALVNTVAWGRYLQPIVILSLVLLVFLVFSAALNAVVTTVVEVMQRRMFVRIVDDFAFRIPRVPQSALDGEHAPELINRFFDVMTLQKALPKLLLDGLSLLIQTVVGMIVLAFYHPWLLGFDVVLAGLMLSTVFLLGRNAVGTAISESKTKYAVAAWLEEIARHPTAFKLNGGNSFALDRTDQLVVEYLRARQRHFGIVLRQVISSWMLYAVAATSLLGLGGWLVLQGELTLGQLVAAELIVVLIVGAFTKIGKQLETFYDLMAGVDKLGMLLDLPLEPHDKLQSASGSQPMQVALHQASVEIDARVVLPEISVSVPAGSMTAIVGPPGTGKSLIADLLCGLRAPATGYVELDGLDLRLIQIDSLRRNVAISRGADVFQGSVDENVQLQRSYVTSDAVRTALKAVDLLDVVTHLPHGMGTSLQTGGRPLTDSQINRLMLARAVAGSPRLFLIDGVLDCFEEEEASRLLRSIRAISKCTIIVLTRRSTIASLCENVIQVGKPGGLAKSG